jgi:hypothetical protein
VVHVRVSGKLHEGGVVVYGGLPVESISAAFILRASLPMREFNSEVGSEGVGLNQELQLKRPR